MRIAYLECFSGISGDMFVGALIDAGVPLKKLEEAVAAFDLGVRLESKKVMRNGIAATKVDVWVGDLKEEPGVPHERDHALSHHRAHEHSSHGHDHHHHDDAGHGHHTHAHQQSHAHTHHHHEEHEHHPHEHGRSLGEIQRIISAAKLGDRVKQRALAIFQTLGQAEAKIHNKSIEQIHFHEVGAIDAIADIVCAAVASEVLDVDEWVCSPVNVGGGRVECAHGHLPVPAPATLEMLHGVPIYSSGIDKELATPTGAAIVKSIVSRYGTMPTFKVESTGYGAGGRDIPGQPNVLRITIGESDESSVPVTPEFVSVMEANLDDLNPQVFGYVMDRLFDEGALDVFGTPVQMKKGRPGLLLTVLSRTEDAQKLAQIVFSETTTLGIRIREERREILVRRIVAVNTPWGEVRMKVANLNGTIANYAPEYDDCRRIAAENGVPLKAVMQEAIRVYLDQQNG